MVEAFEYIDTRYTMTGESRLVVDSGRLVVKNM